jgi:hypothetical protein
LQRKKLKQGENPTNHFEKEENISNEPDKQFIAY